MAAEVTGGPELERPSLLSLPQESITHVLSNLTVSDLTSFALVSKSAFVACVADEIWQPLFAQRRWSSKQHATLAARARGERMQPSELREHLLDVASWRGAYAHCSRSELAVVLEVCQSSVRFGFAGDACPRGETQSKSLRDVGQIQDVADVCDAIARALRVLGLQFCEAQLALITNCRDRLSPTHLENLTESLLHRGARSVRYVDADVAALHAAGETCGVSLFIGSDFSSAAPIIDADHVRANGAGCLQHAHLQRGGCSVVRAHGSAGWQAIGPRAGSNGLPWLAVGMATLHDELCTRLGIAPEDLDARAELREKARAMPMLVYARAISVARRPVQAEELELGRLDVRLSGRPVASVAVTDRFGCAEHWFDPAAHSALAARESGSLDGGAQAEQARGGGGAAKPGDSLQQLLCRALQLVPEEDLLAASRHVVLHGEGARVSGVDQRLANELRHMSQAPRGACVRPTVALGTARAHLAAWVGAASLVGREQRREWAERPERADY